jgi:2,4-didehydro-3-deoxy-L-rhamnonate hydrolase
LVADAKALRQYGMGMKKDGKPAPVYLKKGDVMHLGIEGLGEQTQKVVAFKRKA